MRIRPLYNVLEVIAFSELIPVKHLDKRQVIEKLVSHLIRNLYAPERPEGPLKALSYQRVVRR